MNSKNNRRNSYLSIYDEHILGCVKNNNNYIYEIEKGNNNHQKELKKFSTMLTKKIKEIVKEKGSGDWQLHMSKNLTNFRNSLSKKNQIKQKISNEPQGIWTSGYKKNKNNKNHYWIDFITTDFTNYFNPKKDNYFLIKFNPKNILQIKTEKELEEFNNKFKYINYNYSKIGFKNIINWPEVAKKYQGINITPYIWEVRYNKRYEWYNTWDVASQCVWNNKAILEIVKIDI